MGQYLWADISEQTITLQSGRLVRQEHSGYKPLDNLNCFEQA